MKHVQGPDHRPPGEHSKARQSDTGTGYRDIPGLCIFPGGEGAGPDHRGRRFTIAFRDQSRTVAVIGNGPSLAGTSAAALQRFPAICINDAWRRHPGAEALYAADWRWWETHASDACKAFAGTKISAEWHAAARFEIEHIRVRNAPGLSKDPSVIHAGGRVGNGGAQGINIAFLTGARRILLFGFDMRHVDGLEHWFGQHPKPLRNSSPYAVFIEGMSAMAADLAAEGVEVLNATTDSAIKYWPRLTAPALQTIIEAP